MWVDAVVVAAAAAATTTATTSNIAPYRGIDLIPSFRSIIVYGNPVAVRINKGEGDKWR